MYDGLLFGGAYAVSSYIIDWIMMSNGYNYLLKPIVAYIVYMWLYNSMYI